MADPEFVTYGVLTYYFGKKNWTGVKEAHPKGSVRSTNANVFTTFKTMFSSKIHSRCHSPCFWTCHGRLSTLDLLSLRARSLNSVSKCYICRRDTRMWYVLWLWTNWHVNKGKQTFVEENTPFVGSPKCTGCFGHLMTSIMRGGTRS